MIAAMSLGNMFTSTVLPNPALQHHYAVLHALALGEQAEPEHLGLQDTTAIKLWDAAMGEDAATACIEAAKNLSVFTLPPGSTASLPALFAAMQITRVFLTSMSSTATMPKLPLPRRIHPAYYLQNHLPLSLRLS